MSAEEEMDETEYLSSDPEYKERLLKSIEQDSMTNNFPNLQLMTHN